MSQEQTPGKNEGGIPPGVESAARRANPARVVPPRAKSNGSSRLIMLAGGLGLVLVVAAVALTLFVRIGDRDEPGPTGVPHGEEIVVGVRDETTPDVGGESSVPANLTGQAPSGDDTTMAGTGTSPEVEQPIDRSASTKEFVVRTDEVTAIVTPLSRERSTEVSELLKPKSNRWKTEVIAEIVQPLIERLLQQVAEQDTASSQLVNELAAAEFACGHLRPADLEVVFRRPFVTVTRPVATDADTAVVKFRGADGLSAALHELQSANAASSGVRTAAETIGVTLEQNRVITQHHIEIVTREAERVVTQQADWKCYWIAGGLHKLQLAGVEVSRYEQVIGDASQGTWFTDGTATILGGSSAYTEQLQRDTGYWVQRIEKRLGIDLFGHQGLAVGDVNGDGLDDVYLCEPGGLPNRLFLQRPDGTAIESAAEAGLNFLDATNSALLVDLDNDGDQDLVLAMTFNLVVLSNDGQGRFSLRTQQESFTIENGQSLSAADYDQDGDLDIFACCHGGPGGQFAFAEVLRDVALSFHDATVGQRNRLLQNDGAGLFSDVTDEVGLDEQDQRLSFAAAWEDFDNDGDQDLYVANDFGPNCLYRNDPDPQQEGRRQFTNVAPDLGVAEGGGGQSVTWADFDHDGWMDVYVGNIYSAAGQRIAYQPKFKPLDDDETKRRFRQFAAGNVLWRNPGKGGEDLFRNVSFDAAVARAGWAWGSLFVDIDNDGWDDLLVANGLLTNDDARDLSSHFWREVVSIAPTDVRGSGSSDMYQIGLRSCMSIIRRHGLSWAGNTRNELFLNTGGPRFAGASAASGLDFAGDGRAVAVVDWDQDGDLDLWTTNRTAPRVQCLLNDTPSESHFLALKLTGHSANRDAIGARVEVVLQVEGQQVALIKSLRAGEGFLGQSSKWLHFGIGDAKEIERVVVRWPGGEAESFDGIRIDGRYHLVQDSGTATAWSAGREVSLAASPSSPGPVATQRPEPVHHLLTWPLPIPLLAYETFDGETLDVPRNELGLTLLHLWSSWSGACHSQLQTLAEGQLQLREAGVDVLALAVDDVDQRYPADPDGPGALIDQIDFPFAAGRATVTTLDLLDLVQAALYDGSVTLTLPSGFLLDSTGKLVALYHGEVPVDRVVADAAQIVAGQPLLKPTEVRFTGQWLKAQSAPRLVAIALAMFEQNYIEQGIAYDTKSRSLFEADDDYAQLLLLASDAISAANEDLASARFLYRALKIEPDNLIMKNNLAWLLATSDYGRLRHPTKAIKYAREANEATKFRSAPMLDTFGAALASAGRFDQALKVARRGLAIAEQTQQEEVAAHIRRHIRLYEQGQPFIEEEEETGSE